MLRRSATVLAATSALVLTATASALANEGPEPDKVLTGDGFNATCEMLELTSLGGKVEPADDVDGAEFPYTAKLSEDGVFLDVKAKDGFVIDAVLVKGGKGTHRFNGPDFKHMFSPEAGNSGGPAAISHYEVCGHEGETPDPDTSQSPNPGTTETPDTDKTKTPGPEMTETPEPETSHSPAPVPTAVPAGASGSGDASMGPVGIVAAALMVMVGGAALLRRRFAHQS